MKKVTIPVDEFAAHLQLHVMERGRGDVHLDSSAVNRPGLQFSGYFIHFAFSRIQIIGNSEMHYLQALDEGTLNERLIRFMNYPIPCIVYSRGHRPLENMLNLAKERGIPVFVSDAQTAEISHKIIEYLNRLLAPSVVRHGVLMDVYGVGVLLMGESGMGKSETALEMVRDGQRLVADDVVEIRRVSDDRLIGSAPDLTRHLMEIRGIGIIDVRYMYGVGAVMMEKEIDLVIEMEMWQEDKYYDRLGLEPETIEILGVSLPYMVMPVRPGRNMAIITEVAARNYRLKALGYDAAQEFDNRWIQDKK